MFAPKEMFEGETIVKLSKDDLINILKIEHKVRFKPETLEKFDQDMGQFMNIEQGILGETLQTAGYQHPNDDSLKAYFQTLKTHLENVEVQPYVKWMDLEKQKYWYSTLVNKGEIFVTENRQTELYNLDNKVVKLGDLINNEKYNVIVTGSFS